METFIVILLILAMLAAIYGFFKLIKFESVRFREDQLLASGEVIDYPLFKKFITRKIKEGETKGVFSLVLVTIGHFDQLVDTYGIVDAKLILKQTKDLVRGVLPTMSIVANSSELGSILIYLPKLYHDNEMKALARSMKRAAETKIKVFEEIFVQNNAIITYVTYPLNGKTFDSLFANLNLGIYLGQKSGGETIISYSNEMQKDKAFIDFYYEIKEAIRKKEFVLFYHPIIDAKRKEIYGFESLIRWNHPKQGLLLPKDFLAKVQSSGDLDWIGFWSLDSIVRFSYKAYKEAEKIPYRWHLNISHQQLLNNEIVNEFQETINRYRIDPELITLEIVDFAKVVNHQNAIKTLIKLSNIGFKIAVSIHETDYQLLADIEKYEIDIIKLSTNILKRMDQTVNKNFVETIYELQRKGKAVVIVENIESDEDSELALNSKFNLQQGYYFSEPFSESKLNEFVQKFY
ncbi:MAG: EAL domain-containing protein [Acholeplasmataceae bacterium]|nr:EAL domain-containing protein [Acholeplasmataceae bacterium]